MPKKKFGSDHYDGRYGIYQVGVYNGAGYNAPETNYKNKVPEYRVTIRPLPDYLPGLQATYFGLYGQGNSSTSVNYSGQPNLGPPPLPTGYYKSFFPDWIVNMGYVSYQHPWFLLAGQVFATKGNQAGNWTTQPTGPGVVPNPNGQRLNALWTRGYAFYGDAKLPLALAIHWWKSDQKYPLHAFARFDWFDADVDHVIADNATYRMLITGMAYHLYKDNLVLLAYERTWYGSDYGANFTRPGSVGGTGANGTSARVAALPSNNGNLGTDQRFQMVFQISY